jgi:hypothetical protein
LFPTRATLSFSTRSSSSASFLSLTEKSRAKVDFPVVQDIYPRRVPGSCRDNDLVKLVSTSPGTTRTCSSYPGLMFRCWLRLGFQKAPRLAPWRQPRRARRCRPLNLPRLRPAPYVDLVECTTDGRSVSTRRRPAERAVCLSDMVTGERLHIYSQDATHLLPLHLHRRCQQPQRATSSPAATGVSTDDLNRGRK